MEKSALERILGGTPCMTPQQAERLSSLVEVQNIESILELGFAHGVSTCYLAATLERRGNGSIVTIDRESARSLSPSIDELLQRLGLQHRVTVYFEPTSYNWRLMRFLEQEPRPSFDLCFLDGAHSWFVDGLAFFLVDRLLKPGGWIVMDDLDWTYARSPSLATSDFVRDMPEDERNEAHVRKVYELLVRCHPDYHNFRIEEGWAFAQKRLTAVSPSTTPKVVTQIQVRTETKHLGVGWLAASIMRKLFRS
jgi:predicted O-methyltransferase YrrM